MTTRREFVVGTTLAAGVAAVPGAWRMPAPPVDRIERVGLELYTLRAAMKADVPGTLARVAQIVGNAGGNILEVRHNRLLTGLSAKSAELIPEA